MSATTSVARGRARLKRAPKSGGRNRACRGKRCMVEETLFRLPPYSNAAEDFGSHPQRGAQGMAGPMSARRPAVCTGEPSERVRDRFFHVICKPRAPIPSSSAKKALDRGPLAAPQQVERQASVSRGERYDELNCTGEATGYGRVRFGSKKAVVRWGSFLFLAVPWRRAPSWGRGAPRAGRGKAATGPGRPGRPRARRPGRHRVTLGVRPRSMRALLARMARSP
jgi:hypothetical protein